VVSRRGDAFVVVVDGVHVLALRHEFPTGAVCPSIGFEANFL